MSSVEQQFQYTPFMAGPLTSPGISDTASISSSSSPSPLYFLDDSTRYSMPEASSGMYMYAMASQPATNTPAHHRRQPSDPQAGLLPQQMQMTELMPMDYNMQQHQQAHHHRYSTSSINTASSFGSSVFSTVAQSPPSSLSSINSMAALSPLDVMSPTSVAPNAAFVGFDPNQPPPTNAQLEYMVKLSPPTPRYSFSTSDLTLDPKIADHEDIPAGAQRRASVATHQPARKRSRTSITEDSIPIKVEAPTTSTTSTITTTPAAPNPAPTSHTKPKSGAPKRKRAARRRLTENQKIAHNKIEKKYRTNINEKIFGLEDLISPLFRCEGSSSDEGGDVDYYEDEFTPGHSTSQSSATQQSSSNGDQGRPNKSKILERAASYIKYLKSTNAKLREQNNELKYGLSH